MIIMPMHVINSVRESQTDNVNEIACIYSLKNRTKNKHAITDFRVINETKLSSFLIYELNPKANFENAKSTMPYRVNVHHRLTNMQN